MLTVSASASPFLVLFEQQNPLSALREHVGARAPAAAAPNHNGIELLGHFVGREGRRPHRDDLGIFPGPVGEPEVERPEGEDE